MMHKRQRMKMRELLFTAQGGLCCYCRRPMWVLTAKDGALSFGEFRRQYPQCSREEVRRLHCTLEHLRKKGDRLYEHRDSLAASCHGCNSSRGDTPWNEYATIQAERFKDWPARAG